MKSVWSTNLVSDYDPASCESAKQKPSIKLWSVAAEKR